MIVAAAVYKGCFYGDANAIIVIMLKNVVIQPDAALSVQCGATLQLITHHKA